MNKLERRLKGQFKFKKRLRNYQHTILTLRKNYCLKTTGKPCSCPMCSPGRVEEKAKYRFNKFDKNKISDE